MQEINISSVKFRNFMSFGNTWNEISFDGSLSTFVSGLNMDTDSANGSGKTSFYQSIVYGLYNKSITNISLQRLINSTNSVKNTLMEVIVNFTKAEYQYQVHRKRGSENTVILYRDGIDITPDSIYEADALIEQILGISFEIFSKVVVFSGSAVPFLDLPIAQQRSQIEELFNITILTEKAVKLKKDIQATEGDIKVEEALLKEKSNNLVAYKNRLSFAEQKVIGWEESKEVMIATLQKEIDSVANIDFEKEQLLFDKNAELLQQLAELNKQLSTLKKDSNTKQQYVNKYSKELEHLKGDECPYCNQKYKAVDGKIEDLEEYLLKTAGEIEEYQTLITIVSENVSLISDELNTVQSQIQYTDLPSLLKTKNNLDLLNVKLLTLISSENPHFDAFEQVEQENILEVDYQRLDELKLLKDHQVFLLKLLTDKNSFVRRRIINETIPFLNSRLNYYTIELGLPHIVRFDDNMACSVEEFGRELDFGNLSGGEKKRVNLSMSLAFRDVLHHLHAKINILLVDEIDAALCPTGVDAVVRLLKRKTIDDKLNTWVIMHRDNVQGKFDRNLTVTKQGGFSWFEFTY
jgi:DNA repair exonuclease SbcCD ATPase subunit